MPERNTRLLAAIMFTDIEGYTALMQSNEAAAIRLRDSHREVMDKYHKKHKGKIVQYYGDGSLSIFSSCVEAVKCAISIQKELYNDETEVVPLRIGVHLGDIIERDDDIIGNGVNIASRIEGLSVPGSVLISKKVADEISNQSNIQLQSMGLFSFKNAQTPIEVLAIKEEGLVLPVGKQLQGKFTKRKSSEGNLLKRLPTWAKYAGGLALLALLIPLSIMMLKPVWNSNKHESFFTVINEQGEKKSFHVIDPEDIKHIYTATFQQERNTENKEWLELGIPYALNMGWSQDPRLFPIYKEDIQPESFNGNLTKARSENCAYLLQGSYSFGSKGYEISASIFDTGTGSLVKELDESGKDFWQVLEALSVKIEKSLGIKNKLGGLVRLPAGKFLTNSVEAYQAFCEGIIYKNRYPGSFSEINQLLTQAVDQDPSFAWGHFYLSEFHNYHNISHLAARKHIDLAMQYRDKMPENQNAAIRRLHYRINNQPQEALLLSEYLHKSQPSNPTLLYYLIQEYYSQNRYEEVIELIQEYRELQAEPSALLGLITACHIQLDESDDAIDDLEEYLTQNATDTDAMTWLGKAFLAQEEWENAERAFQNVQLLAPEVLEIPRLLAHVEFMKDSSEYINMDLFDRFLGLYWAEGMSLKSSHSIQSLEDRMYYKMDGSLSRELMYALGKYSFFSYGSYYLFIPNEKGRIDRMSISEGYILDAHYLNYEVDAGILTALRLFEEGEFSSAEAEFNKSLEIHPQHAFLQYYLDHLAFRKTPEYKQQIADRKNLEGNYETARHKYRVFLNADQLFIQSATNVYYRDPIPLLPLSSDTYLDTHKLTFRLRFIKENGNPVRLEFLNDINKTTSADYRGNL